ncbi:MAG TPA: Nif11-like leader peptide family RiPP precursor [Thermoanaerobaculia bacterium]|jgi:predicted ribosomally synthesized peptide with nif11-like leader
MSRSELQRFLGDLRRTSGLSEEFERLAGDLEAQVRWAHERGYAFDREEAAELTGFGELTDEELEEAAGGWTGDPPPP